MRINFKRSPKGPDVLYSDMARLYLNLKVKLIIFFIILRSRITSNLLAWMDLNRLDGSNGAKATKCGRKARKWFIFVMSVF